MTPSPISQRINLQDFSSVNSDRLNFSYIASIKGSDILAPIEAKTHRTLVFKSLTDILDTKCNESTPKFQQLIGEYFIFLMSIFQEINVESEKHIDEGYGHQGSRMAFHRRNSLVKDFKQALGDPRRNTFLFVTDEKTGEILGSTSLLQCENGLPELSNFYVSKSLRRDPSTPKIGLGKYLFASMLDFAKKIGHEEVFLTSRRKGGFEKALNVFNQFGFKEVTKAEEVNRLVRPEYQSTRTIPMLLTNLGQ